MVKHFPVDVAGKWITEMKVPALISTKIENYRVTMCLIPSFNKVFTDNNTEKWFVSGIIFIEWIFLFLFTIWI